MCQINGRYSVQTSTSISRGIVVPSRHCIEKFNWFIPHNFRGIIWIVSISRDFFENVSSWWSLYRPYWWLLKKEVVDRERGGDDDTGGGVYEQLYNSLVSQPCFVQHNRTCRYAVYTCHNVVKWKSCPSKRQSRWEVAEEERKPLFGRKLLFFRTFKHYRNDSITPTRNSTPTIR